MLQLITSKLGLSFPFSFSRDKLSTDNVMPLKLAIFLAIFSLLGYFVLVFFSLIFFARCVGGGLTT